MTLRVGIIEGANTVGRNFLLPGDGSCRTVGSAGRYVNGAAFGVVVPVRRDEKSTFMLKVPNPDWQKKDGIAVNKQYLEARCRYYVSSAPPPLSQINLVQNKPFDPSGVGHMGFAGFPGSAGFGADEVDHVVTEGDANSDPNSTIVQPPAGVIDTPDDVEADPNEDYEQMQGSTLPSGFDAGQGEEWVGKLLPDSGLVSDPPGPEVISSADPGTQTNPTSQPDPSTEANPIPQPDSAAQQDASAPAAT